MPPQRQPTMCWDMTHLQQFSLHFLSTSWNNVGAGLPCNFVVHRMLLCSRSGRHCTLPHLPLAAGSCYDCLLLQLSLVPGVDWLMLARSLQHLQKGTIQLELLVDSASFVT